MLTFPLHFVFSDLSFLDTESLESSVAHSPISSARLEELSKVFLQATELEIAFWDDAMKY